MMNRYCFLLVLTFLLIGCNGQKSKYYDETWLDDDSTVFDTDTMVVDSVSNTNDNDVIEAVEEVKVVKEVKKSKEKKKAEKHHSSRSSYSYDDNDKSDYANDGHPGTKPDDGLFGFDYYDDADDAYEMDRNQSDPYPDEW